MALTPAVQQMLAALRAPHPQVPAVPNYAPAPPNLNPNLAKEALRVQQVATGQAKPTSASWG